MSMDALKATFFAECEELVEAMTEGLQQIAEDDWDSETVNAIFRAVHSIKGSAGAFGFETLDAFAHRYETVLDKIRSNMLGIDADVRNGFSEIRVRFEIDADASADEIAAVVAQSQRRSAVFDIITNPTNVRVSVA